MKLLMALAVIAIVVIAVMTILRRPGPRVTHIKHRREDKDKGDDRD